MMKPNVVLVNDTSLFNTHFGCQLVGQVFREQFQRTGLNLIRALPLTFNMEQHRDTFSQADLVIVNGEGSVHHGKNMHLIDLAEKYPSALVNCVYQENPKNNHLKQFLYISARESASVSEIQSAGAECSQVPDLIFNSSCLRSFPMSPVKYDLGITDNVVNVGQEAPPTESALFLPAHSPSPARFLNDLSSCRRICSGRFHAVIACVVLEIPFSSWDSNTWKTRSLMEDMGIGHNHFNRQQDALNHIPETFPEKLKEFVRSAQTKIEGMFDQLSEIARRNI